MIEWEMDNNFKTKINISLPISAAMFKCINNIAQDAQAKKPYSQGNKTRDNLNFNENPLPPENLLSNISKIIS